MDGIENFYTHDKFFVGMTFIDELRARLFLTETPYEQIMKILRLISHKVKKFDTLNSVTRATKYYNELIKENTFETDRYKIVQRQKIICHFYESHYKARLLRLSGCIFNVDLTKRMSYSDYIIEIEYILRNCHYDVYRYTYQHL